MLTLLLLRHATAQPHGVSDFDRELSPRGRSQARSVGEDLRKRGLLPDLVLCSAAVRTQQTWQEVLSEFAEPQPEVRVLDDLYETTPAAVRDLVRETAPESGTVLVIGHEPIMSMTSAQFAGPDSDAAALMGVRTGMPTASYAIIDLTGPAAPAGTLRELVRCAN